MMKFKKVRNEQKWKAENGTIIYYNAFLEKYCVERRTFSKFVDTLDEAKKVASTDCRFH